MPCMPGWSRRIPLRQHPVAVPRSKIWAGSCRERAPRGGVQGDVTGDFISSQFSTGFAVPLQGSGACRLSKKQFQGGIFQAQWTDFCENTSPEGRGSQGLGCLDAGSPPKSRRPHGLRVPLQPPARVFAPATPMAAFGLFEHPRCLFWMLLLDEVLQETLNGFTFSPHLLWV